MTTKRITAVLAAAAVCAASGVTASAAGKYQLLTEPMSTVDGTEDTYGVYDADGRGKAPFISYKEDTGLAGVFDITQKDLKKWHSSGEFTYTEVNVDNFDGAEYFDNAEIDLRYYSDAPGMVVYSSENDEEVLFYSYENGSLNSVPTMGSWYQVSFDGYELSLDDTRTWWYITNHNDGVAERQQLSYAVDGWLNSIRWTFPDDGKYLGYWINSINETMENEEECLFDYNIYGITREGQLENIYSETDKRGAWLLYAGDNFLVFESRNYTYIDGTDYLYSTETGEVVKLPRIVDNGYAEGDADYHSVLLDFIADTAVQLNGNKMVVKKSRFNEDGFDYYLVEIGNEESENGVNATLLSNAYGYMKTYDGERYLVKTLDGKWGFLNSEGELAATYDDAGEFMGKYAPVVKDGKAYLVNRNFKCVSEKIDAESVRTLDNGLYRVTIDGENYFMTYSKNDDSEADNDPQETEQTNDETADLPTDTDDGASDAQDEQTESDPADTDTSADENTSSDTSADTSADDTSSGAKDESKANPDTGAAGAGIAIGLTVFAAGAVLLSRKRR